MTDRLPFCRLGGVKITSRPAVEVHEISTFGRFRSSLRRGRRQVRMIIDLTQCHGRTHGVRSIMGSTVRGRQWMNATTSESMNEWWIASEKMDV